MSTPELVSAFYERIWNRGELAAAESILHASFSFRGSLGDQCAGIESFLDYVRTVRACLAQYRCDILDCVSEGDRAFARMRFSGSHVASLRGWEPTGLPVEWQGAALFTFRDGLIVSLWVLGDLAALESNLERNAVAQSAQQALRADAAS